MCCYIIGRRQEFCVLPLTLFESRLKSNKKVTESLWRVSVVLSISETNKKIMKCLYKNTEKLLEGLFWCKSFFSILFCYCFPPSRKLKKNHSKIGPHFDLHHLDLLQRVCRSHFHKCGALVFTLPLHCDTSFTLTVAVSRRKRLLSRIFNDNWLVQAAAEA